MWCCQNTQVGEGHVNANCLLIVQALYGLPHSSSNCKPLRAGTAGLPVLVSTSLTEKGPGHKRHVACSASVVAVTWNIVPFSPATSSRTVLLWLLELSERIESITAVEHFDWDVGAVARHRSEMVRCWLNHLPYETECPHDPTPVKFSGELSILMGRFYLCIL